MRLAARAAASTTRSATIVGSAGGRFTTAARCSAEGFALRTVRAPRRPGKPGTVANDRDQPNVAQATLADDLVRLARELSTVVVLAGGEAYASAVSVARSRALRSCCSSRPAGGELTTGPLIQAATRAIRLHPEVFEALFEVRDSGRRGRPGASRRGPRALGAC